jgi:foldase protein PrsA
MDKNKEKKIKPLTIVWAVIIIAAAYVIVIGIAIYAFGVNNKLTKFTENFIPYPAAVVGYSKFIPVNEVGNNLQSIKRFYENQDFSQAGLRVDFTTVDGKKRLKVREKELLNKMIEDKAIEILAKKNGIMITNDIVDQNVKRRLDEFGTEAAAKENLNRLYGWTMSDFKEKIVKPALYSEELEKIITEKNKDGFVKVAQDKIDKAKSELDGGKDFSEVAKNFSDGSTAGEGGELGWFAKDQLISEIANAVFAFKKGQRSDIIESVLGFHIVEVEDRKTDNNQELIKIRQIFSRKITFADWLGEQMKNIKIFVPLKGYYWNLARSTAEFKDADLKEFENNLNENSQGDASVTF